jgi:SagB-type dehydrogenase family enzyme
MSPYLLSLRDDVVLDEPAPGEVRLRVPGRPIVSLSFRQVTPALRDVFAQLRRGVGAGATEDALAPMVLEADGPHGLFKLTHVLARLNEARIVCRSLAIDGDGDGRGVAIARLVPISDRFVFDARPRTGAWRLSRFALTRRDGDRLVVESPLGFARLELLDARAAAALALLTSPVDSDALGRGLGWTAADAEALLSLLANAGALTATNEKEAVETAAVAAGAAAPDAAQRGAAQTGAAATYAVETGAVETGDDEDRNPALLQWEVHDLYFHSRSRLGRHANPFGGVFRFEGRVPPLPAIKPPMHAAPIALPTPDLDRLRREDMPLTRAIEQRRSVREHDDETSMTLAQLGEFLYRTVRVTHRMSSEHGEHREIARRLYPAGGALYETEVYVVVDRVEGLPSGLYHHDPAAHTLEPVAERTRAVAALLDAAFYTADQRSRPQVLLVLAARFQRLQWKYQSMAYAAMLKHVGVIYQTMYLVATAMGLAPCALGGGHSDLFAEAAGLDYYAETSIGEFIIGTPSRSASINSQERVP